jgi:hypothetical protein
VHLEQLGVRSVRRRIDGYHYEPPLRDLDPRAIYEKERERGISAVYFHDSHPLRWVKRFTMVENGILKGLFSLLGRGNWFLRREKVGPLRGLSLLIIRYKGYFDGVKEERDRGRDLVFFSNGPGEVSTWVTPIVDALKEREPVWNRYRKILVIHPCQFGSGTERVVADAIGGIDTFVGPRDYLKLIFLGKGRKRFKRSGIGLSLGGDLMHLVLFR